MRYNDDFYPELRAIYSIIKKLFDGRASINGYYIVSVGYLNDGNGLEGDFICDFGDFFIRFLQIGNHYNYINLPNPHPVFVIPIGTRKSNITPERLEEVVQASINELKNRHLLVELEEAKFEPYREENNES